MESNCVMTERKLFIEISKGNSQAFRNLFILYRLRIFGFAYGFTHSAVDAEEIVQDTFLSLWNNKKHLSEIINPQSYIFRIAKNRVLNHLDKTSRSRKLMQQVWANIEWSRNAVDEEMNANECKDLLNQAIKNLPLQKQKIFLMSREAGLSHEEIASEVGLSKSRVKNIIVETLNYLKWYLTKNHITIIK